MPTATIRIPVSEDLAREFEAASEQDRKKLELLVGLSLRGFFRGPRRTLDEIMEDLGRQSEQSGLTQEILDEIIAEPGDD